MTPTALPAMLRCAWPRPQIGDVTVTHAATFAPATPLPVLKDEVLDAVLAKYRESAIRGVNYAFGHGWNAPVARPILQLPQSSRPAPREPQPVKLLSKNGKRLPLRAIPWRDLNREVWSHGKTVRPDMERSEPRELLAHEKQAHEMSLDELVATADREPLSESRRSWLTRGAGVMSLEGITYAEGSIGETVAASGFDLDTLVEQTEELDLHDEHDAVRFGTAIELLDPITAKQIDWEKEQHGNSEITRIRIAPKSDGSAGLAFVPERKLLPDVAARIYRSVKRSLAAELRGATSLDEFHARVDLAREGLMATGASIDFGSADANEERERLTAPVDAEWHSAFMRVRSMIEILSEDWSFADCSRPRCSTFEEHRHVRVAQPVHRRPQNVGSADEFWRTDIFDVTAFELGTDGLVDPLVVEPFTNGVKRSLFHWVRGEWIPARG